MKHCCIVHCHNVCGRKPKQKKGNTDANTESSPEDQIKFLSIPTAKKNSSKDMQKAQERQRVEWLSAINKKDLNKLNPKNLRVYSKHFITGKPAYCLDTTNPDWRPSLQLGYEKKTCSPSRRTKLLKYSRARNRDGLYRTQTRRALQFEVETLPKAIPEEVASNEENVRK